MGPCSSRPFACREHRRFLPGTRAPPRQVFLGSEASRTGREGRAGRTAAPMGGPLLPVDVWGSLLGFPPPRSCLPWQVRAGGHPQRLFQDGMGGGGFWLGFVLAVNWGFPPPVPAERPEMMGSFPPFPSPFPLADYMSRQKGFGGSTQEPRLVSVRGRGGDSPCLCCCAFGI